MHNPLCIVHYCLCITFVHKFYAQAVCKGFCYMHIGLCMNFP